MNKMSITVWTCKVLYKVEHLEYFNMVPHFWAKENTSCLNPFPNDKFASLPN